MSNVTIPIIRLEVEGMKTSIMMAIADHQLAMDEALNKTVEAYCRPENIDRVVGAAVAAALDTAIKAEVTSFFGYGEGRKLVAAAVREKLLKRETGTFVDAVGDAP